MACKHYKLDENRNVVECSFMESLEYFSDDENRITKQTEYYGITVSTICLQVPHGFKDDLPYFFETAILGGVHKCYIVGRYLTDSEAREHHDSYLEPLKNLVKILAQARKVRYAKRQLAKGEYDLQELRHWYSKHCKQARKGISHK